MGAILERTRRWEMWGFVLLRRTRNRKDKIGPTPRLLIEYLLPVLSESKLPLLVFHRSKKAQKESASPQTSSPAPRCIYGAALQTRDKGIAAGQLFGSCFTRDAFPPGERQPETSKTWQTPLTPSSTYEHTTDLWKLGKNHFDVK